MTPRWQKRPLWEMWGVRIVIMETASSDSLKKDGLFLQTDISLLYRTYVRGVNNAAEVWVQLKVLLNETHFFCKIVKKNQLRGLQRPVSL